MKGSNKNKVDKKNEFRGSDFVRRLGEEGWAYIKTIVDTVREPILILDADLRVMSANEPFYRTFQVEEGATEGKLVYELGNGQWAIPSLKKLLENILPENTFFKGFEVVHEFPVVGRKAMLLNARQIYCRENKNLEPCAPIILLAMEDMTEMLIIAETLAGQADQIGSRQLEQSSKLEKQVLRLEKEISMLKTRS